MLRFPDYNSRNFESGKGLLSGRIVTKILAFLLSLSMLAWGVPSAHAECASGCGCESANHGTPPGVGARVRGVAHGCCAGHGGDPCQTALKQSFSLREYALAAVSWQESPLPMSSALGSLLASLPANDPGRPAGPWKAPLARPDPPLYLSNLTLLI
jgi:hypothetical protein